MRLVENWQQRLLRNGPDSNEESGRKGDERKRHEDGTDDEASDKSGPRRGDHGAPRCAEIVKGFSDSSRCGRCAANEVFV